MKYENYMLFSEGWNGSWRSGRNTESDPWTGIDYHDHDCPKELFDTMSRVVTNNTDDWDRASVEVNVATGDGVFYGRKGTIHFKLSKLKKSYVLCAN